MTKIYWLHALSPTHVGTGTGAGFIDLPIMREKTTGWPLIPGSAIKGVRRDHFEQQGEDLDLIPIAFGQADNARNESGSNSGAIVFTDARLVCLPVASYYGTFAWVTSPMVLRRLKRDASLANIAVFNKLPDVVASNDAFVPSVDGATRSEVTGGDRRAYIADLDIPVQPSQPARDWAVALGRALFGETEWASEFRKRFIVVPDDTFNFLCHSACEVQARVHIDDNKKTVMKGQLWYEESLPAESILFGLVWCDRIFDRQAGRTTPANLLARFCSGELPLQVGGKATVGRGRVRCIFGN